MSKDAVFTMKLETALRDDFIKEASAAHRPASQVIRELMREFIQNQRNARQREELASQRIDAAGTDMLNDDVDAP